MVLAKICILLFLFHSASVSGQEMPSHMKSVSQIKLSILWFDIYTAELLTETGQYAGFSGPLMLKLNYLRNISQRDLLSETKKDILNFSTEQQASRWLNELLLIWPAIKKADQLAFTIDDQRFGHFFHNKRWIGSINDPAFSIAFVQIWLSKNSRYPKLAKQLRAEPK